MRNVLFILTSGTGWRRTIIFYPSANTNNIQILKFLTNICPKKFFPKWRIMESFTNDKFHSSKNTQVADGKYNYTTLKIIRKAYCALFARRFRSRYRDICANHAYCRFVYLSNYLSIYLSIYHLSIYLFHL